MLPATQSLLRAFRPAALKGTSAGVRNCTHITRCLNDCKCNSVSILRLDLTVSTPVPTLDLATVAALRVRHCGLPTVAAMLWGMKKWLAWVIIGGPVVVYAIGKFLSRQ